MQVISNLIVNSIYAMPDGGTLSLSVCDASSTGNGVVLTVEDDGVGVGPEDLPRFLTPSSRRGLRLEQELDYSSQSNSSRGTGAESASRAIANRRSTARPSVFSCHFIQPTSDLEHVDDQTLGNLLLEFDRLFKQSYVIIGIRQHALSAIRDDGCPANLYRVHDINRVIDQGHRDCGAFVIIDPHRSEPDLPSLWICISLLISGTSRQSIPKRTAKLTSD